MKTKLFTLLFALIAGVGTISAETVQVGDLNYSLSNVPNTAHVVSGNYGALTTVSIPSQITYEDQTYDVTVLEVRAFKDCSNLISVTIPNGIEIGAYAFENCTRLTSVTLPDEVPVVSRGLFLNCTNLASITIPQSVTKIYDEAFYGCTALTSIAIPSNVTTIGESAFAECVNLASISFPESVTSLGANAFDWCYSLTSLEIPNTITSIGEQAFFRVANIIYSGSAPEAPWGAKSINGYIENQWVYSNSTKTSLLAGTVYSESEVIIPEGVISIGNAAFMQFNNLETLIISDGVTIIGDDAFAECENLSSVDIPASVTSIGDGAFAYCSNIASITCRVASPLALDYYTFIGVNKSIPLYVPAASVSAYQAASGWSAFTNILPIEEEPTPCLLASGTCGADGDNLTWELSCDSVLTISGTGKMKNYGWTNSGYINAPWYDNQYTILSIVIEDGVTSIGSHAFYYCTGLTSVTIPHSVTSIGTGAFEECGLTSIEIPNSVASIGDRAFFDCDLTSIEIPNSVNFIGSSAFEYCINLTGIIIPASVTNIGEYAFLYCSGLESIIVENGNIAYDSRDNCNAIIETSSNKLIAGCKNTTIPNNITTIGRQAFSYCSGLTNATIPNSVISIERAAFSGCSGLTSIISEAVTPPTCSNTVFNEVDKSTCVLYVPAESINAYREATGWSEFTNILPIPGTEPCLIVSGTCGAQGDNLTWELSCDGVLTISSSGDMTDWSSPSDVPWYSYRNSITSVIIGNSVTSIGDYAFYEYVGLTSVTIPNSVTSIGNLVFQRCQGLTSIEIPNSVTSIGSSAFNDCSGLTSVTIPNSVTSIGDWAFAHCSNLTSVIIGNSVTSIGDYAFVHCSGLTSVTIPNSVTSIGNVAFSDCSNLTSVTIGNSVTNIGLAAFSDCSDLTSITLPSSVTSIGAGAIRGCSSLTSITCEAVNPPTCGNNAFYDVDKSIPLYVPCASIDAYTNASGWNEFTNIQAINPDDCGPCLLASGTCGAQGDNLTWELSCDSVLTISGMGNMTDWDVASNVPWYSYRNSITSVIIGDSVTNVGNYAFYECSGLTRITIPSSVNYIGSNAFRDCTSLTSVEIPNSVTSIRNSAFGGCNSLTSITIPNSVTSIGSNTFRDCTGLTSIVVEDGNSVYDSRNNCNAIIKTTTNTLVVGCQNTNIPNSVTSIGSSAFERCSALTSITIPNSVTSIGNSAFEYCIGLTSVEISNGVTSIGGNAFSSCTGLTSIEIPNSVTSIGQMAFESCSGLTSITISNSVTSIGRETFYNCTGLTSIEIPNSVTSIEKSAFERCSSLMSVTIGISVTSIGDRAFRECTGLTSIEIPNSIISIGSNAFRDCTGLISIEIPDSVTNIGDYAFKGCSGLLSVTNGNSVTSIGRETFYNCTGLTSITCEAVIPPTCEGSNVFKNVDKSIPLYVPAESINAYQAATGWSEFTNIQAIPGTEVENRRYYSCDFETEAARNRWIVNPTANQSIYNQLQNKWYIGEQGNNDKNGHYGLYISNNDGVDAQYQNTGCWTIAYDIVSLDQLASGDYTLYFDWCAMGNVSSHFDGLYMLWIPMTDLNGDSLRMRSIPTSSGSIPSYYADYVLPLQSAANMDYLNGTSTWRQCAVTIPNNKCDGMPHYLAFVWANGSNQAQQPGAMVDNIVITDNMPCDAPTNLMVSPNGTTMSLTWNGSATEYEVSAYSYETSTWFGPKIVQDNRTSFYDMPIGQTDFIVRAVCSPEEYSLKTIVSLLIYYPDQMCVDYMNLNNAACYINNSSPQNTLTFNDFRQVTPIDMGPASSVSRHTVHFDRTELEPRTGDMAKTVPEGEFASVRLGNWETNNEAERIEYTFTIDANSFSTLRLKYLPILEAPNHAPEDNPCFKVDFLINGQSLGQKIEINGSDVYSGNQLLSGAAEQGWHVTTNSTSSDVLWKEWTTFDLDLSNPYYQGQQLTVRLTTHDCAFSAHYGYAYFTLNCVGNSTEVPCEPYLSYDSINACAGDTILWRNHFITARDNWTYEGNTSILLEDSQVYADTVKDAMGCDSIFQLYVHFNPSYMTFLSDTIYEGDSYYWHGRDLTTSGTYQWVDPDIRGCDSITMLFLSVAPRPISYPVVFLNWNGDLLSEQYVAYNHAAEAPQLPVREGYVFMGWTAAIEHVTARTFAIALYEKVGVNVTYKGENGEVVFSEQVDLHIPEAPSVEGKSFSGWLTEVADNTNGIVLRATYTVDNPTDNEDVTVVPGSTTAEVNFPYVTGAVTYMLVIRDLYGQIVCKIMFNANGQLLGIAFAPGRRQQQSQQTSGFSFTVEGLTPSTTYEYEFVAHDETDAVIETLTGSFTTTLEIPTDVQLPVTDNRSSLTVTKIIKDDHVYILRGDKIYTVTGQEMK